MPAFAQCTELSYANAHTMHSCPHVSTVHCKHWEPHHIVTMTVTKSTTCLDACAHEQEFALQGMWVPGGGNDPGERLTVSAVRCQQIKLLLAVLH